MSALEAAAGAEHSVSHATFVIQRSYAAPPAKVFAAWASAEAKAGWFACHDDWKVTELTLDFKVGGEERVRVQPPGGPVHAFDGQYWDIVPDRRIVYAYAMRVGEQKLSVSLATVELLPAGTGTTLEFTEQGAFLDSSQDPAERQRGTEEGLDSLGRYLDAPEAP